MKSLIHSKKKNNKISLNESRSCSICHERFYFNEFKNVYHYLSSYNNPVESFFNILNNKDQFKFIPDIDISKTWKNLKHKVFCPSCLVDFKHAYNLKRKCIDCEKEITFLECSCSSFNKNFSQEALMRYWINPLLQFYCCSCYKKKIETS